MKRSRLRAVSKKVRRGAGAWAVVYAQVDARSGGWCEVEDGTPHRATEHQHLFKPRRSHHQPHKILHVCRTHHAEFEPATYAKGKRVVGEFDANLGRYRTRMVWAKDKFEARALGLIGGGRAIGGSIADEDRAAVSRGRR